MMDFLFVNTQELTALMELPLSQRVTYLMGIRPYMDKQTCIVGIKRKISYQSLREVLYVAPIPGVKSENPSHQQVRRVVKSLERAGLVAIESTDMNLILKCLLVEADKSVQNKAGMRPTPQADMKQACYNDAKSTNYQDIHGQADRDKTAQADTPHNSENNNVFISEYFEKFWASYPQPQNKEHAWHEFKKLNPDEALFSKILAALNAQLNHYHQQQAAGNWMPTWKYPNNWLAQQCWKITPSINTVQENPHASTQTNHTTKTLKHPAEQCESSPAAEASPYSNAKFKKLWKLY